MIKLIPTFIAAVMLAIAVPTAQADTTQTIWLHPSELLDQGTQALRSGDYKRAIKSFKRFLKEPATKSSRVTAHSNLCIAYEFVGDLEAAVKQCNIAIKLNPKHWRAYNNRGNAHLAAGDYEAASADYQLALKINPKAEAVLENLKLALAKAAKQ
ncbi:MAG: tetratricopeptide repeat protein [Sphingomonadales bacterium]